MFRAILFLTVLLHASAYAVDWFPIEKAELERSKPKIDPDAPAEVIFWHVYIEDKVQGDSIQHIRRTYQRIKIFNEKGRDEYSKHEVTVFGKSAITNVSGRTLKPDGSVVEMKRDGSFDRDVVKTKSFKVKARSFALPDVKVGDVVEYQYTEVQDNTYTRYEQLAFQREIPVWEVRYHLKPLVHPAWPYSMRSLTYNINGRPFSREPQGYYVMGHENMPAIVKESLMPPEDAIKAWALVFYEEDRKLEAEKFWSDLGKRTWNTFKPLVKVDKEIKRKAEEITSAAGTPQAKAAAIEAFCRQNIKNIYHESSGLTSEQRDKFKDNKDPASTLAQGMGTGTDTNLLFIALATAAGLDARMARIPNRSRMFFNKTYPTEYHMNSLNVAVNIDGKWRFYDPATPYLESGMLHWGEEGVSALVSDPKGGFFADTQFSEPARSTAKRRAMFELTDDGELSGLVVITSTGHLGMREKNRYDGMSPSEREEDLKKELESRFPGVEIQKINFQNVNDLEKPPTIAYRLKIPGYATRTGKRLLLEPCFFERGIASNFKESTRKNAVYIPYAYLEDDEVIIKIPEGWELDNATNPGEGEFGAGGYKVAMRKSQDGQTLIYQRKFDWGRDMKLAYPVDVYPQLKKIFDFVYEQDHHVVSFKQKAWAQ
jgi:hypothetical protein